MFQKKQVGVLLLAGAGAAAAVGLAFATPQKPTKAQSAAAADLTAMMRARSPGERLGAETNKPVKVAMASSNVLSESSRSDAAPRPARRAAPAAAIAPAPTAVSTVAPAVVAPAPAPSVLPAVAAVGVPAAVVAGGLPAAAGFAALPIIPAFFGGGGGGGGSPAAVSAVPEPATWLMMILGFGIMGSALRRRRRYGATSASAEKPRLSGAGVA